jgi:hypothetical protein
MQGAELFTESANDNYVRVAGLTPDLTGAAHNAETAQALDERLANYAAGRMTCCVPPLKSCVAYFKDAGAPVT